MINLSLVNNDTIKTRYNVMADNRALDNLAERTNFLIYKADTVTLRKASGVNTTSITVEHNLGYEPAFVAYYTDNGGVSYSKLPFATIIAAQYYLTLTASIDKSKLIISVDYWNGLGGISPSYNVLVKYYIFREKSK